METTVQIDDKLLNRAEQIASRSGRTLSSIIEEGLSLVVAQKETDNELPQPKYPVSKAQGRLLPGVNIDNNAALDDLLSS